MVSAKTNNRDILNCMWEPNCTMQNHVTINKNNLADRRAYLHETCMYNKHSIFSLIFAILKYTEANPLLQNSTESCREKTKFLLLTEVVIKWVLPHFMTVLATVAKRISAVKLVTHLLSELTSLLTLLVRRGYRWWSCDPGTPQPS